MFKWRSATAAAGTARSFEGISAWGAVRCLHADPTAHSAPPSGHFPVVIAGAGPTGLTLAAMLSRLGVRCLLLERAKGLPDHPQAHYINTRTMEVFRSMGGGLAAEVARQSPPLDQWRSFVYCESVTGNILGSVDHFPGQSTPRNKDISPELVVHLSQNRLLPLIMQQTGDADIRFGHSIDTTNQVKGKESVTVSGRCDSSGESFQVECDYLIAADGANSRIRDQQGIKMEGVPTLQHLMNIHFHAPKLWDLVKSRPAMLYFVFNPTVISVLVAHDLESGELVAQVPIFPPLQQASDYTPEESARLVRASLGITDPDFPIEVHSARSWAMSAEVAERYSNGRVILAGDAAHRFPPAGGFGMNTGIQDAHNLAWKLAAVLQGRGGSELLASYEAERRQVALANTALSLANFEDAIRVPAALGLDRRAATLLHAAANGAASVLPTAFAKSAFEGALAFGRWSGGIRGPLKAYRASQLAKFFNSGSSLRLQYPREDLGFVYNSSGVVCGDIDAQIGGMAESAQSSIGTAVEVERGAPYVPITAPGARLPHVELTLLSTGEECSAIDLVGGDGNFVLLLDASPASLLWKTAADRMVASGWPLRVVHIAADKASAQAVMGAPHGGAAESNPTVALDSGRGDWARLREVAEGGAILVRPDGHVGWRCLQPLAIPPPESVNALPSSEINFTALHVAMKHLLCESDSATA